MSSLDDAGRCAVRSAAEPMIGTAPRAHAWLVLDQPGPYGFTATTDSHLPERVRESLGRLPKDSGTTVLLSRPVGRHADDHVTVHERRFWFAHTSPGGVRMRTGMLSDDELLRPDLPDMLAAAARGELPPWGARTTDPLLLVCTNSRRDVCCALAGRPLAEELAADRRYAGSVRETSHLGGHRFAPTALLLPYGVAFGRLTAAAAHEVLDQARLGRLGALDHVRGRSSLSQPAQVAGYAVRRATGIAEIDDVDALRRVDGRVLPAPLRWEGVDGVADTEVRHPDGRAWRVVVRRETLPDPRPESCGKDPARPHVWVADTPEPLPAWR